MKLPPPSPKFKIKKLKFEPPCCTLAREGGKPHNGPRNTSFIAKKTFKNRPWILRHNPLVYNIFELQWCCPLSQRTLLVNIYLLLSMFDYVKFIRAYLRYVYLFSKGIRIFSCLPKYIYTVEIDFFKKVKKIFKIDARKV